MDFCFIYHCTADTDVEQQLGASLNSHDYLAMTLLDVAHYHKFGRDGMNEIQQIIKVVAKPGTQVYDLRTAQKRLEK